MGARTIDEGSMDEQGGMNFSEYVAILSSNTDLLDKAKLEKQIASLESERKSFHRGKSSAEAKLENIMQTVTKNGDLIARITTDLNHFQQRAQRDGQAPPQSYRTGRCQRQQPQTYRKKARRDRREIPYPRHIPAHRQALRLRLHRKPLLRPWRRQHLVQLQRRQTDKRPQHCRPDAPPHLRNHSPSSGEIPKRSGTDFQGHSILQEVVKEMWKKEDRLKQLKSDLAALDHKIQLSLKPVKQNEDSNSKDESQTENQGHGTNETAGTIQPPASGTPSASPTTSPVSDGKPYSTSHPTSFPPLRKRNPTPEPAPRQFQHQRCHELVRQQTRHRRHPQARQQGRPRHRPHQQAQKL